MDGMRFKPRTIFVVGPLDSDAMSYWKTSMPSNLTVPVNFGRMETFSLIRRLPPDKPPTKKRNRDCLNHPDGFVIAISPESYRSQFKRIKCNSSSLCQLTNENTTTNTIELPISSNIVTRQTDRIKNGLFLNCQQHNGLDCNSSKNNKRKIIMSSTTHGTSWIWSINFIFTMRNRRNFLKNKKVHCAS